MKKQIHIRVDEVLYEKLNSYSRIKTVQYRHCHESIVSILLIKIPLE